MAELIAYYSRRGENYFGGKIKTVEKGNTETLVETLKEITGADVFHIKQVVEYSDEYEDYPSALLACSLRRSRRAVLE